MAESSDTMDMKEFQLHEKETGSADVQIALLPRRIGQLTEHLKSHAKDHSSRRGLLKMVAMRRSLLDYLSKSESDRSKNPLEKLNRRKSPPARLWSRSSVVGAFGLTSSVINK